MPKRPRQPNDSLAQLLAEAGMSSAELARSVNRLAAAQGVVLRYDRTSVAHWLAGSRPRAFVAQLVAEVFTRGTRRLIGVAETGLTQGSDTADPTGEPVSQVPLHDLVALARTDAEPVRRSGLQSYVFRERGLPDIHVARTAASVSRSGSGAKAGAADVDRIRFVVDQFYANWSRFGGAHARGALASYLGDDVARLLAQPTPRNIRPALISATAQLAHILGGMSADAGFQGLAQRYYFLALSTASEAGDRRTRAITLRAMSVQAVRMHAPRYADDLADAAVTTVGRSKDGNLRAFVLAQRAYVRSFSGERRAPCRDLRAAEQVRGQTSSGEGPFHRYPAAGLAYRTGQTLYRLGLTRPALDALRSAADHRLGHEHRLRAQSQARLALVLLDQGHVDEACVHGRLFVSEYPALRSHRSSLLLQELQARLTQFQRLPEAADLVRTLLALNVPWVPAQR
ncbi:hypothetical protein V1J52_24435 [Streptomyces sp. TRM 70351]|uniref:hypothetical protein n=1 Tax=Streptomyces sp. TRM 70351 TaxID=3116552 RepID=UPI002E7BBD5C|nr:hypothetical protein [Streptomyces sp. TRM 70351]MEE1931282.1 hypothetical protein [Streptomyces sp. TRM 70351]